MSNTTAFEKIEKRRIYMKNYRLKKAGKLSVIAPIKEVEDEDGEENTIPDEEITIPLPQIIPIPFPQIIPTLQKEKVKYLLIKPDFTLLIKHYKLHRKLMYDLLRKTAFLKWLNNYGLVMDEFNQKKGVYIEYNTELFDDNSRIIHILVRTVTFVKWLNNFDLVMEEFIENQL